MVSVSINGAALCFTWYEFLYYRRQRVLCPFSAGVSVASACSYYTVGTRWRKGAMQKRKEDRGAIPLCSLAIVAKQETGKGIIPWSHHLPSGGVETHSGGQEAQGGGWNWDVSGAGTGNKRQKPGFQPPWENGAPLSPLSWWGEDPWSSSLYDVEN